MSKTITDVLNEIKASIVKILSKSKHPLTDDEIINNKKDNYSWLGYVNALYDLEKEGIVKCEEINGDLKYSIKKK
jgi:hypothetical protein